MTRRSFVEVERDAIVAERAGVLGFARSLAEQTEAMIAAGKIGAEEGTMLNERLRAFAGGIATGLHRDGNDPPGVRQAMRAIVKGER